MTDYQTRSDIESVPALIALAPAEGQRFNAEHRMPFVPPERSRPAGTTSPPTTAYSGLRLA